MANNSKWVDDRMNALEPPSGWKPNSAAALPKVHERDRQYRTSRARWIGSGMAASIFLLAILLTPAKCAFGVCKNSEAPPATSFGQEGSKITPPPVLRAEIHEVPVGTEAHPAEVVTTPQRTKSSSPAVASVPAQVPARNFKESGSPNAPLTIELFTDYECPHCATVYDQVVPMLLAEYVQTGKVKFIHRDWPLPMHGRARQAARYANAAGRIGKYDLVVNQIFRTQPIWAASGDIDSQVSQVLSPGEMETVRGIIQNDGHLDDTINNDVALAHADNLNQTPSVMVTYKGKRQQAPAAPYSLLKSYLDELLTK